MRVTSAPAAAAPSAKARDSSGEDGRMSWPTTTWSAAVTPTKELPTRRARSASTWSGTVPRTSYALKILGRFSRRCCRSESSLAMVGTLVGAAATVPAVPGWATGTVSVLRPGSVLGAEDPQVTLARHLTHLERLPGHRGAGTWLRSLAHGVREGEQVVAGVGVRVVLDQAQHLPPAGGAEPLAVHLAEVVRVRLGVRRQRAEDRCLVGVHVGERGRGRPAARGAGTTSEQAHGPRVPAVRAGPG